MVEGKQRTRKTVESPEEHAIVGESPRNTALWRGFDNIFEDFRKSFDDLLSPWLPMRTFLPTTTTALPVRAPLVDLVDNGNEYVVRAELPGYTKNMVDVELNKDTLNLRAEKKTEEETKTEDYLHRERTYAACQRTINFPEEVDPSKVDGKLKDGILELRIPKKTPKPEEQMRKIDLQ